MESDQEFNFTTHERVVIGMVQRKGRKCYTQVHNIPNIFDFERMLKYWKKNLKCGGSIQEEESTKSIVDEDKKKYFIQLSGDHREYIEDFLIHFAICPKENIRMQGKSNQ